jgi:intein-encoded DNA endonuclease-like protein
MLAKFKEKEVAIELRKQGYSYSEILKKIPVAKSTLSL